MTAGTGRVEFFAARGVAVDRVGRRLLGKRTDKRDEVLDRLVGRQFLCDLRHRVSARIDIAAAPYPVAEILDLPREVPARLACQFRRALVLDPLALGAMAIRADLEGFRAPFGALGVSLRTEKKDCDSCQDGNVFAHR